jgi:hypothetical protein
LEIIGKIRLSYKTGKKWHLQIMIISRVCFLLKSMKFIA